ncbi:MAG: tetratricopeptide repeat protein [Spirochaetales bacterium]
MYYVLVEIANYRQLSRLRTSEVAELRGLLEHFSANRGGKLVREQNGFFLFSFHPQREKVLHLVSDFLFLTRESLERKKDELFGFNLLLERDDSPDDLQVFGRLKALLFVAPKENSVWAGQTVLPQLSGVFPVEPGDPLAEVLGPPPKEVITPLSFWQLLEVTGWVDGLQVPLARQLPPDQTSTAGKVVRLKGNHLSEKVYVLRAILQHLYGSQEDFPVVFPLDSSRDFLTQLLGQIDGQILDRLEAESPPWQLLLRSRGAAEFPGDSSREDVTVALTAYYRAVIGRLRERGLPPVFVFLSPQDYEPSTAALLEDVLAPLVSRDGLWVLLLEPAANREFLARGPSLAWSFPALNAARLSKERENRGWGDRFPPLPPAVVALCDDRGASVAHYLIGLQEKCWGVEGPGQDPSWALLLSLDTSHHKVYLIFLEGRSLLDEARLIDFFQFLGEDAAVIRDKVQNLKNLGFLAFGDGSLALRPDFQTPLRERLGAEVGALRQKFGEFLYQWWLHEKRLSEIVFALLHSYRQYPAATAVLSHYITHKIDRGEGDFLTILRPELWEEVQPEEARDALRQLAAASKLRFALNQPGKSWTPESIDAFRRFFTPKTENAPSPEWLLQQGRFHLRIGNLVEGFGRLKRALLAAQEQNLGLLETRANTEIGLTLLRRKKLEEGRDYFDIASRMAEKNGSLYGVVQNSILDAMSLFLLGHLSASVKTLDRLEPVIVRSGMQQARLFVLFLRARLEFDRGDYAKALEYLEAAQRVGQNYGREGSNEVLGLWKGRCEAYSGNTRVARAMFEALPEGLERNFFLSEAHYFDRNPALALDTVRRGLKLVKPTQPFCGEGTPWSTGFSALEDRVLAKAGEKGVLEGQAEAFTVLLEGLLENAEAASQRFQTLLAQKSLLDLDITSGQYYFWYYLVLPRNVAEQEALRLTLLGRALKDIQTRASRIEDPLQRQEFLHRPYWNAQYLAEGKRLKLL